MSQLILQAGGVRTEIMEKGEAEEIGERFRSLLADAPLQDVSGITLDISCRRWPKELLQVVLEPILPDILPKLTVAKVDDIIASLLTEDGLATYEYLATTLSPAPHLHTLHIDFNALGTRGADALKPLLKHENLEVLTMTNCGIALADAQTLRRFLSGSTTMRVLDMSRNQMDPEGAMIVAELIETLPNLEEFAYGGNRPLAAGSMRLAQALSSLKNPEKVRRLDIHDCTLGSEDDEAVVPLCEFLARATELKVLVLHSCELDAEGVERVLAAVQQSGASLESLDLEGVGDVGTEGATFFADFLRNSPTSKTLTYLDLGSNELEDEGVVIVVDAIAECCTALETLKLECNQFSGDGCRALLKHKIPTLKHLKLTDNMDVPAQAARRLQAIYETVEVEEDLMEDDDWGDEEEVEPKDEEKDAEVDALGAALANAAL